MWNKLMASSAIALGAAFTVTACGIGDEDIDIAASEEVVTDDTAASAEGQFCGGFAGIACPAGYICIDDPEDSCDPDAGGRDCGGICTKDTREPSPAVGEESAESGSAGECGGPNKQYVVRDPETCLATTFICAEGTKPFFDECGCGCTDAGAEAKKKDKGKDKAKACGNSVCGAGEFCCNESCGICAPIGGVCTQQFCG